MAELASGAVSSLLGVIRNEAALLGGVRGDVQFIKEEMESMHSFLLYLARTAAADGEHDEQVRTWMNQVRLLASDCNNCIDLYLYRGNPDIHLPRSGPQRYLRWAPWFLQRMVAQHRAALKLRELKDRARDVGERRLRYGVEVPAKAAAAAVAAGLAPSSSLLYAAMPYAAAADEDVDNHVVATATTDRSGPRGALLGLRVLDVEDYFKGKLAEWIEQVGQGNTATAAAPAIIPSIAIVAPDNADDADTLAGEALAAAKTHFRHGVFVNIPKVHWPSEQPRPVDILCYIWRDLERARLQHQSSQQQGTSSQGDGEEQQIHWHSKGIWGIRRERRMAIRRIKKDIRLAMKDKIEDIKSKIQEVKSHQLQLDLKNMKGREVKDKISGLPLPVLLLLLLKSAAAEQDQPSKKTPTLATWYDKIIEETSKKLKDHMRVEEAERILRLDDTETANILREVFPETSNKSLQAEEQNTNTTAARTAGLDEQQIQVMIQKAKEEILHEVQEKLDTLQKLQEGKTDKKQATGKPDSQGQILEVVIADSTEKIETTEETEKNQGQIPEADIAEATKKIEEIQEKIEELKKIKVVADKIQSYLKQERTLLILKIDQTGWEWEETRNALSLLGCVAGAVIVTTSKNTQQAKEYCNPPREPMEYSLVGLYHDIVLQLTRKQMNEEVNNPDLQIFRGILEECEPHEFCMKIFAHALYAKPKRSNEELRKLHTTLQAVSPKSFGSIANKMVKFSYNDLQKEYKSCLLYLAIFPPGYKIRRSTLIGRWVVEGLITTEDWRWSSSVCKAKLCFDELIDRWLVYPTDISATGEIKSCMVGDRVYEFITKVAEKQRIVETRLSNHLARHFSISNNLRLRSSDKIKTFFQKLSGSSQFCLLKVLDLEGCQCFGMKNKHYLKDICCKIKLLKYLSLRRTDVIQLPNEINNLHELEVLDIRQTNVHAFETRNLRLLKLKRLLAGHTHPSSSSTDTTGTVTSVLIPEKVENMENMEVLSGVKPRTSQDLKDIGTLWQLRKLGVVIEDKNTHLMTLLEAISNLNKCIRSLSITLLPETRRGGISSRGWLLLPVTNVGPNSSDRLEHPPKDLESLSIRGTTMKVQLLPLLLANENSQLTKITLSNTLLSQNDLMALSKLPMLRSVKLRCVACTESKLTFKKGEFKKLKYFLLEGSKMTEIIFEDGATGELEKIVLPLNDDLSLSGLDKLPKLEELELSSNNSSSGYNSSTTNIDQGNSILTATTSTNTAATTKDAAATSVPNTVATTSAAPAPATTATETSDIAAAAAFTTAAAAAAATTTDTTVTTTTAATTDTAAATTTSNTTTTDKNILRSLLENGTQIAKVTLRGTMLKQDDLQILGKKPTIRCLVLLDTSYDKGQLAFNKNEFLKLNLLIVDCSDITKISFTAINFTTGSCPKLVKFVTNIMSLSGIDNLPRLKELEFKGDCVPGEVKLAVNKLKDRLHFTHYKSENLTRKKETH